MSQATLIKSLFILDRLMKLLSQDGIFNGWDYKENGEVDTKKDLVQPNEKHLDGVPKFIQQPQSIYYVSKSKPVMITCIVQPVSHVNIICADKQYSYMNEEISATGLIVVKMDSHGRPSKKGVRWKFSLEVKHKDVVEWFSEYRCVCEAWNQIEQLQRVKKVESNYAIIYEAYINKQFKSMPKSQEVLISGNFKLSCLPPDAKPPAEIYWLKNGEKITSKTHPQIEINDYGELLLSNARITDSGNYSCVATSFGIERYATAKISVIDRTSWSEWSKCSGYPCTKERTRKCSTNICTTSTLIETINCTINECGGFVASFVNNNNNNNNQIPEGIGRLLSTHDIAMYVGLFVAISVFLMVAGVIFCLIHRKILLFPNRIWRYSNNQNGNLSNKQINLIDVNQPNLYRSIVLPNSLPFLPSNQSDTSTNSAYTDVGNDINYIQHKHLPSLPMISTPLLTSNQHTSLIRPSHSDSKVSSTLYPQMGLLKHISTLPIPISSTMSEYYQELGNTDNEQSEKSMNEPCSSYNFDGENVVWESFNVNGGKITLPLSEISLACPTNSFAPGISEQLFLKSCSTDQDIPELKNNETLLSSVVVCGPVNVVAFKPFILTLPHCGYDVDSKNWDFSILTSYSPLKQKPYWQKFLKLDDDASDSPLGYAHMTKDKLYLMTNQLQRFCVIGSSCKNKQATKIFRIAAYCTGIDRRNLGEHIVVRVYLVPDISESLSRIHNFETNRLGARLLTNQKQFLCEDEAGNITVTISDLAMEWQTSSSKTFQEIPFQDVWHSTTVHCSFTFIRRLNNSSSSELKISINSLDCNWFCTFCLQQSNSRHNKQTILLSTPSSSSHTSVSASSTQFSNYSTGGSQNSPYFVDDCNKANVDPIFKLPEATKIKLCKLLDSVTPLDNDWRQLAKHLSINGSLKFFSNKLSSTEILLDLWEAQNQTRKSVSILIECLTKIGRLDCVGLLEKELLQ